MADLLQAKRLIWGIVFLIVTAVALLSYASGTRYLAASQAVEQTLAVQSAIDGTLSLFKDLETGQRGFVLTGDERFLEPYWSAKGSIPGALAGLEQALSRDQAQAERMRQLRRLADDKSQLMEGTIRLRREGDADGALARVRTTHGKQLMDAIRELSRKMRDHEQGVLTERRLEAGTAKQTAAWAVGIGSLVTLLLALVSWLTVNRDVQALRRTAEELAASEEHFRLLAENTSDLVRLLDLDGKATYVSPSVEPLLGYTAAEYLALPGKALMHPDELATAGSILTDVRERGLTGGNSTYRLRGQSGAYRYFEVRWSVLKDATGKVTSLHTVGRDVTERRMTEELLSAQAEELRSLSLRDELTKLYNRRGFLEIASQTQAQAARDKRPAALVFVDLNGMKRINDELGHDAGDDALRDAASVLVKALSSSDVVARLGGDEFVAFSVDFTASNLEPLRRRLRSLADEETARLKRPYRLSMSAGAAYNDPASPESLTALLERADAAMYEQKRARKAAGGVSLVPPA